MRRCDPAPGVKTRGFTGCGVNVEMVRSEFIFLCRLFIFRGDDPPLDHDAVNEI